MATGRGSARANTSEPPWGRRIVVLPPKEYAFSSCPDSPCAICGHVKRTNLLWHTEGLIVCGRRKCIEEARARTAERRTERT